MSSLRTPEAKDALAGQPPSVREWLGPLLQRVEDSAWDRGAIEGLTRLREVVDNMVPESGIHASAVVSQRRVLRVIDSSVEGRA